MLRRGLRTVAVECSCSYRKAEPSAAAFQSRRFGCLVIPRRKEVRQSRVRLATLSPSNAFSTSPSWKGKEKESRVEEEEDLVIRLLSLLIKKRDLLLRRQDAVSNVEIAKQVSDVEELHGMWKEWQSINQSVSNLLRMTNPEVEPDEEMRTLALEEAESTLTAIDALRGGIKQLLLPTSEVEEESAILEARPGIGGDESALFVGEVVRMYTRFCESIVDEGSGLPVYKIEELSSTPIDTIAGLDAFKEVILHIKGKGAYGLLKNEAGIHRVQRVPATQKALGKLHSSTIAVLVLPGGNSSDGDSADARAESKDDIVDPKDVKTEVMRSRGAGGQHVNKTESAIRLTHEPTGITVSMQDSRSQHQNRVKAWAVLRARLQDRKMREDQTLNRDTRRSQIGGMDRGDRIKTYNFPQDRVTDHRVSLSSSNITGVMNGDLQYLMDSVREHREQLALQALIEEAEADLVQMKKQSA